MLCLLLPNPPQRPQATGPSPRINVVQSALRLLASPAAPAPTIPSGRELALCSGYPAAATSVHFSL